MQHILFSPHIDDAFLSLGGSILNWRERGDEVKIIYIFSKSNTTREGAGDVNEITNLRKEEERKIAKRVGSSFEFLDIPEATLRDYKMSKGEFKHPQGIAWDRDKDMFESILGKVEKFLTDDARHYFPLGIGGHVDHELTYLIGEKLSTRGDIDITFWEDIPYVGWFGLPDEKISKLNVRPELYKIDINKKLEITDLYSSQIEKEWVEIMKTYPKQINSEIYQERIWVK